MISRFQDEAYEQLHLHATSNIALRSPDGAIFAVERFLASMDWNGCADQLTNWDGTQKLGLGAPPKKSHKVYPDNDNERQLVALVTANHLK